MSQLIHIYEQCRTKNGWNDGDGEPHGIDSVRDTLVRLINAHLPPTATTEAYAFNREGIRNRSLLLYRTRGTQEEDRPEPDLIRGLSVHDLLLAFEDEGKIAGNLTVTFHWSGALLRFHGDQMAFESPPSTLSE